MTQQTKDYLKLKFETGDKPTQQDFHDLIDSCYSVSTSTSTSTSASVADVTESPSGVYTLSIPISSGVDEFSIKLNMKMSNPRIHTAFACGLNIGCFIYHPPEEGFGYAKRWKMIPGVTTVPGDVEPSIVDGIVTLVCDTVSPPTCEEVLEIVRVKMGLSYVVSDPQGYWDGGGVFAKDTPWNQLMLGQGEYGFQPDSSEWVGDPSEGTYGEVWVTYGESSGAGTPPVDMQPNEYNIVRDGTFGYLNWNTNWIKSSNPRDINGPREINYQIGARNYLSGRQPITGIQIQLDVTRFNDDFYRVKTVYWVGYCETYDEGYLPVDMLESDLVDTFFIRVSDVTQNGIIFEYSKPTDTLYLEHKVNGTIAPQDELNHAPSIMDLIISY